MAFYLVVGIIGLSVYFHLRWGRSWWAFVLVMAGAVGPATVLLAR